MRLLKSNKKLVEEIHETFYTEVDRLLEEAKKPHSLKTDKQELIDKSNRLMSLGFASAKEVDSAKIEKERLAKLKKENEEKESTIRAIQYFTVKYPQYKFITEESVLKICNKYGLVYGEVSKYTGTVPDKNLKHIEDFRIHEDDECYRLWIRHYGISRSKKIVSKRYCDDYNDGVAVPSVLPLEIAAPKDDFDLRGMKVENFKLTKIKVPDPVVLKPVMFEDKKYYLIVTAWGDEASDELVVNQNMN